MSEEITGNQALYQPFLVTPMSPEVEQEERWKLAGAFPSVGSPPSDEHVFTDEPSVDSYRFRLESVAEESVSSKTSTGVSSSVHTNQSPEILTITSSGDGSSSLQQQHTLETKASGSSSGVSYPYTLYNNLSDSREDRENINHANNLSSKSTSMNKSIDIEESSLPKMPSIPVETEESSVVTEHQEHIIESASLPFPFSVTSTRSRRQNTRYMVRHTLPTSQKVPANSASLLKDLFIGIEQKRHMHKLTSKNMKVLHNWLIFVPALVLTLLTGIIIFVFETSLDIDNDGRIYASIGAGILSFLSVFWQALNRQLDLTCQAAFHEATAGTLKRLSEDIIMTVSSTELITAEYVALIGEKFDQALDTCPSMVPYNLESSFTAISHRVSLMLNPPVGQVSPRKHMSKVDIMKLYASAYDELTAEIISFWAWPFCFPSPRKTSDTALRNFKLMITEGRETDRRWTTVLCPCIKRKREKSLFEILPAASTTGDQDSGMYYPSPSTKGQSQYSPSDPHLIRNHMLGEEV